MLCFFFFQAEDGIRSLIVTGVQTCALPICNITSALDYPLLSDRGKAYAGLTGQRIMAETGRDRDQVRDDILAALAARHKSGLGQHIDISLLDSQIAWLVNQGVSHLVSGETPVPLGNGHPTIVPYEAFPAADHAFILAVGNDGQFAKFCAAADAAHLSGDPRFARNTDRVHHRDLLIPILQELTKQKPAAEWISLLEEVGVPCGPINTIPEVFADPHVQHRDMKIELPHPASGDGVVSLIGNPLKFSETPVHYERPPPTRGADTRNVLTDKLSLSEEEVERLRAAGVIESKQI